MCLLNKKEDLRLIRVTVKFKTIRKESRENHKIKQLGKLYTQPLKN